MKRYRIQYRFPSGMWRDYMSTDDITRAIAIQTDLIRTVALIAEQTTGRIAGRAADVRVLDTLGMRPL